ncbi:LysM peptidoglycan-binding domain-containing protein [Enterococcus sp. DIV1420a]|uniref:LysM peptidoglycan-binding domain-containing protein n=1 Tax=Enterococcus sp. DIV1420a TaxID=2774672 RepID=UPI003F22F592
MKKMMTGLFLSAITLGGLTFSQTIVHADNWKANTPEQIQITKDQKEYTLKNGDTLWAIGQKININVEALAKINHIDLAKGEEKNLPVGRVISFDGNMVTVKDADGSVVDKSEIKKEDKVDPKKPVGEPVSFKKVEDTKEAPALVTPETVTPEAEATNDTATGALENTETPSDTGSNTTVTSAPQSQPMAPATATTPAETPAPKPVEATPAQPVEQQKPTQPLTIEEMRQNVDITKIPAEILLNEETAKMWGVSRNNGWIPTPYPVGSDELMNFLVEQGYSSYDSFGDAFIQPHR